MTKITEHSIESFAIEIFKDLKYDYIYAPDIAPDSQTPERDSFEQVLLLERLQNAVKRLNKSIPADAQAEAIKTIQRIASPDLLTNNEAFHRMLTEGIPISKRVDGMERGDRVLLIDFNNPKKNDFANCLSAKKAMVNYYEDILIFSKTYDLKRNHPLIDYFMSELEKTGMNQSDVNRLLGNKMGGALLYKWSAI